MTSSNFEIINVPTTINGKQMRLNALKALLEMYKLEKDNQYETMMIPRLVKEIENAS